VFRKKTTPKVQTHPVQKGFYAWNALHAGSFLLFVEAKQDLYTFVFLPGPSYMNLSKDTFDGCIKTNTLEFVEALPDDIYGETIEQAKLNGCHVQ
jgi:hypothetical protein